MRRRTEPEPVSRMPTGRLPLPGGGRAVGGPVRLSLLASYVAVSLVGWLAAAIALVAATPDLAAGIPLAQPVLLAVHLVALGFLPIAVAAGTFHLLPVMLRNDLRSPRRLWLALPLLAVGGWLIAPGVAYGREGLLWPGTALLTAGLALVLLELGGLVVRAPRGRMLVVSRLGVGLSLFHAVGALTLGAVVFRHGYLPLWGVSHERWLLIHLHVAILGWLALLILTVGRTLGPMLALAPAAPTRTLPVEELALTLGLWVLAVGIAIDRTVAFVGAALVLFALVRFGTLLVRIARTRRSEPEGPLIHLLAGAAFLAQAAVLGLTVLGGALRTWHALTAYVLLLLLGWAAGVTVGHLPKLLSLSIWVWWPPGPRPKQTALYPRRLAQVEAVAFALGVQVLATASYFGSPLAARAGAVVVAASALLAVVATTWVWQQRWQQRSRAEPAAPATTSAT